MEEERHLNYDYFIDIDADKLPRFVHMVFSEHMISDKEKFRFVDEFLLKYLNDDEFRKESQELDIFFVYFKFWNKLGMDRNDADIPRDTPGTRVLSFTVTDNPVIEYFLPIRGQVNVDIHSSLPKIDTKIYVRDDYNIHERRLLDTGASYTTIPGLDYWDYETGVQYKDYSIGAGRNSFNFNELNDNIFSAKNIDLNCAEGGVIFKKIILIKPIFISIDGLPPVSIKEMIAPLKKTDDMNVIGFDMIKKHTIIISSYEGVPSFKVLASEDKYQSEETTFDSIKKSIKGIFGQHENEERHLTYDYYINANEDEIPRFAHMVFSEHLISDEEKFRFVDEFLIKYLNNVEFRKESQEKSLFFVYFKLWNKLGINRYDAEIPDDVPGTRVLGFIATDNPVKLRM